MINYKRRNRWLFQKEKFQNRVETNDVLIISCVHLISEPVHIVINQNFPIGPVQIADTIKGD